MIDWFNEDKDNVINVRRCSKPYDMIFTGSCPYDGMTLGTASSFDIYLNLCENALYSKDKTRPRENTKYAWSPIDELEFWKTNPFCDSKIILDHALENNLKTYVHCASGSNRSPLVTISWLASFGHSIDEASNILDEKKGYIFSSKFQDRIESNNIPENIIETLRHFKYSKSYLDDILK